MIATSCSVSSAVADPGVARPEHDEPAADEAGERGPAQQLGDLARALARPARAASAPRRSASSSEAMRSPSLRLLRSSTSVSSAPSLPNSLRIAMSSSRSIGLPRSSSCEAVALALALLGVLDQPRDALHGELDELGGQPAVRACRGTRPPASRRATSGPSYCATTMPRPGACAQRVRRRMTIATTIEREDAEQHPGQDRGRSGAPRSVWPGVKVPARRSRSRT